MAVRDWNGDGKKTFADDFIEYQIYNEVTKGGSSSSGRSSYSSSGTGGGCLNAVAAILGAAMGFGIIWLFKEYWYICFALIAVVVIIVMINRSVKNKKYLNALEVLRDGEYALAAEIFSGLGNYKQSQGYVNMAKACSLYIQKNGFTNYDSTDFESSVNELKALCSCVPSQLYDDGKGTFKKARKRCNTVDEDYKKFKLAGKLPYIGLEEKYIDCTKFGKHIGFGRLGWDDDHNKYSEIVRYINIYSKKYMHIDSNKDIFNIYTFNAGDGKYCSVCALKGVVRYIYDIMKEPLLPIEKTSEQMQLSNMLPYEGLDVKNINNTKLGHYISIKELRWSNDDQRDEYWQEHLQYPDYVSDNDKIKVYTFASHGNNAYDVYTASGKVYRVAKKSY